jgi:putative endonuclease
MVCPHALGRLGEALAAQYLIRKGYRMLHRNWKCGRQEIDIIALQENTLVFVEVKTRSGGSFYGKPEAAVGAHKKAIIRSIANQYVRNVSFPIQDIRFDIISMVCLQNWIITHFEDAFG